MKLLKDTFCWLQADIFTRRVKYRRASGNQPTFLGKTANILSLYLYSYYQIAFFHQGIKNLRLAIKLKTKISPIDKINANHIN